MVDKGGRGLCMAHQGPRHHCSSPINPSLIMCESIKWEPGEMEITCHKLQAKISSFRQQLYRRYITPIKIQHDRDNVGVKCGSK